MWRIGWAPNNASKWQVGFNSAFKGLIHTWLRIIKAKTVMQSVSIILWNLQMNRVNKQTNKQTKSSKYFRSSVKTGQLHADFKRLQFNNIHFLAKKKSILHDNTTGKYVLAVFLMLYWKNTICLLPQCYSLIQSTTELIFRIYI